MESKDVLTDCSKQALITMIHSLTSMVDDLATENTILKLKYEYNEKNNPYFEDYITDWLEKYKYLWQDTTFKGYYNIVYNHIVPYFKGKEITIRGLKVSDLEAYYAYLLDLGLSPNTVRRHHANIRKCLRTAQKDEMIKTNPALIADLPSTIKATVKYYNVSQLQQLLKYSRFTEIYTVILLTSLGLRRSEAIGMQWKDIDFDTGILTIKRKVIDTGEMLKIVPILKTKSSYRALKLPPAILTELDWIFTRQVRQFQNNIQRYCKVYLDYICVDFRGNLIRPDTASRNFTKLLEKGNLPSITLKGLRHSCATILLTLGFELKYIQEWLGHSTIVVTGNTYAHIDMSHKAKVADALEDIYKPNTFVSA